MTLALRAAAGVTALGTTTALLTAARRATLLRLRPLLLRLGSLLRLRALHGLGPLLGLRPLLRLGAVLRRHPLLGPRPLLGLRAFGGLRPGHLRGGLVSRRGLTVGLSGVGPGSLGRMTHLSGGAAAAIDRGVRLLSGTALRTGLLHMCGLTPLKRRRGTDGRRRRRAREGAGARDAEHRRRSMVHLGLEVRLGAGGADVGLLGGRGRDVSAPYGR